MDGGQPPPPPSSGHGADHCWVGLQALGGEHRLRGLAEAGGPALGWRAVAQDRPCRGAVCNGLSGRWAHLWRRAQGWNLQGEATDQGVREGRESTEAPLGAADTPEDRHVWYQRGSQYQGPQGAQSWLQGHHQGGQNGPSPGMAWHLPNLCQGFLRSPLPLAETLGSRMATRTPPLPCLNRTPLPQTLLKCWPGLGCTL